MLWETSFHGDLRAAELINIVQDKSSLQIKLSYPAQHKSIEKQAWLKARSSPSEDGLNFRTLNTMNILTASSFPFRWMGSIKVFSFKEPTLWGGYGICSLQLQQGIGWICGHHLHPANTAWRWPGLDEGCSPLAHASNSQRWEQQTPMTPALCDTDAAAITAEGSFAVRWKQSGGEATFPRRQLPLPLWFRSSFLLGKGRIPDLLSQVLNTSVLGSSAPLKWHRQCSKCQSAVIQANPLLYAHGVHWESTQKSHTHHYMLQKSQGLKQTNKQKAAKATLGIEF